MQALLYCLTLDLFSCNVRLGRVGVDKVLVVLRLFVGKLLAIRFDCERQKYQQCKDFRKGIAEPNAFCLPQTIKQNC